jgi:AAA15 family ATPase/GTPase
MKNGLDLWRMLISFSVENFRSIRDLQTLSMVEPRLDHHLEWSHLIEAGNRRLLKSAAIFGPNASGKSNVLQAMIWLRQFILASSKEGQAGEPINTQPFRLSTATEKAASHFEIEFIVGGHEYRYGFEATSKRIESEWLFRKLPTAKAAKLFTREGKEIESSSEFFKEGKGLEARTRENALFLSVCAQWDGPEAVKIIDWMQRFRWVSGLSEAGFYVFTAQRLGEADYQGKLLELARKADFNISALRSEIEEITEAKLPADMPAVTRKLALDQKVIRADIKTTHEKRDEDGKVVGRVEFDLAADESQGTQKFIALSGPVTHTLEQGSILVVDELEARLHPLLTQALVDLFHSPVNRKNAQLVFAAHDVTLLDPDRFRRDQIWFTEKDEAGATDLYSLADFKPNEVRAESKFSRQYLLGLFGAVPKLAHFQEAAEYATRD